MNYYMSSCIVMETGVVHRTGTTGYVITSFWFVTITNLH